MPITSLKIDRSFVARLNEQTRDTEVVRAVITLGQALGKTVIAEGIETPAQLAQLKALGCEYGQGYLLARPLTPEMAETVGLPPPTLPALAPVWAGGAPTLPSPTPAGHEWSLTMH